MGMSVTTGSFGVINPWTVHFFSSFCEIVILCFITLAVFLVGNEAANSFETYLKGFWSLSN